MQHIGRADGGVVPLFLHTSCQVETLMQKKKNLNRKKRKLLLLCGSRFHPLFKWFAARLPSHKLKWIKAQGRVGALESRRLSEKLPVPEQRQAAVVWSSPQMRLFFLSQTWAQRPSLTFYISPKETWCDDLIRLLSYSLQIESKQWPCQTTLVRFHLWDSIHWRAPRILEPEPPSRTPGQPWQERPSS